MHRARAHCEGTLCYSPLVPIPRAVDGADDAGISGVGVNGPAGLGPSVNDLDFGPWI